MSGSPGTFAQIATVGANVTTYQGLWADSQYHVLVPGAGLEWGWLFFLFQQCQCHDIASAGSAHESDCHGSLLKPDQPVLDRHGQ